MGLQHLYGANFQTGILSTDGLQAFEKNLYQLLTDPGSTLNEWALLEKVGTGSHNPRPSALCACATTDVTISVLQQVWVPFELLRTAKRFRSTPILGPFVESFMFARLAFLFELAVNFIQVRLPWTTHHVWPEQRLSRPSVLGLTAWALVLS